MRDDWFGHRHWVTGEPLGDKDEWLDIDLAIVWAYQTIEVYTDQNGIFSWYKEDPEERIGAIPKIDPFQQQVDSMANNPKRKRKDGEYFIPEIISSRPDGSMWTYQDWLESQEPKDGKIE